MSQRTLSDLRGGAFYRGVEVVAALFVLIGAAPRTEWLLASVARDRWGYVLTGPSDADPSRRPFETTSPGIFAVGDVRHDSVKRVAAAVGEDAVCIRLVHDELR